MTKDTIFGIFSEWKKDKENKEWRYFAQELKDLGINNIWKNNIEEIELRKKLGLNYSYVDKDGWTVDVMKNPLGELKEIWKTKDITEDI